MANKKNSDKKQRDKPLFYYYVFFLFSFGSNISLALLIMSGFVLIILCRSRIDVVAVGPTEVILRTMKTLSNFQIKQTNASQKKRTHTHSQPKKSFCFAKVFSHLACRKWRKKERRATECRISILIFSMYTKIINLPTHTPIRCVHQKRLAARYWINMIIHLN